MRRFLSTGAAHIVGLLAVLALVLGVAGAVFVASRGTGFVNFASLGNSSKWIGTIGKTPCTNTTPDLCYKLYENNLEGTPHYITSTNQDLESFVAKNVLVRGQEQKVNKITYIVATKISETELSNLSEQVKPIEANLGLKIVPVLGLEMGKVDLNLTWTDKVKANNPQEVEQIKEYSFAVYKNSVKPANLVGVRVVDTTLSDAPRSITGVMVGNGDYLVQMGVYYQRPGGKVYRIKSQTVGFGYSQDKFEKKISSVFEQLPGEGKISWMPTPDSGAVRFEMAGGKKKSELSRYSSLRIWDSLENPSSKFNFRKAFDAAIQIYSLNSGNKDSADVGMYFTTKTQSYDVVYWKGSGEAQAFACFNNSHQSCFTKTAQRLGVISSPKIPATMKIGYDGKILMAEYDGQRLTSFPNKPAGSITEGYVYAGTNAPEWPYADVYFDNFRLVWVK